MTGLQWESPSGLIKMALGDGHQAIQTTAVGTTRINPTTKAVEMSDIEHFAAECVNPPPGIKAEDWIAQGFHWRKMQLIASRTDFIMNHRVPAILRHLIPAHNKLEYAPCNLR